VIAPLSSNYLLFIRVSRRAIADLDHSGKICVTPFHPTNNKYYNPLLGPRRLDKDSNPEENQSEKSELFN
jgi:hypothetical protein